MDEKLTQNKRLGQVLFSAFSNVVVLLLSIVTGFFLPKYVSMETYAFYKTFILYVGYVGLFHFGLINGIYLKYGGLDYCDVPKVKFRSYTRVLVYMQLVIQLIMLICLVPYQIKNRTLVSPYFFVIVNIILVNINCYFNIVNQFTRRFVLDGVIQLIQKLVYVIGIVILLVIKSDDYVPYLIVFTGSYLIVLVLLLIFDRELVFGPVVSADFMEIKTMISKGFFIMISEYMGLIIVGIDSIIINLFFPQNDFSIYAFAVSIISVMYQLTNTVSKPVFPYLKRQKEERIVARYDDLKEGFIIFAAFIAGFSLIIPFVIHVFIPKYEAGSIILQVLAVTVIIRAVHELLFGNYFKVLSMERLFVKTNIIALVVGVLTDVIAFLVFRSMYAIAIASVISFAVWYFVSDYLLQKNMNIRKVKGNLMLLLVVLIYSAAIVFNIWVGSAVYYLFLILVGIRHFKNLNIIEIIRNTK